MLGKYNKFKKEFNIIIKSEKIMFDCESRAYRNIIMYFPIMFFVIEFL